MRQWVLMMAIIVAAALPALAQSDQNSRIVATIQSQIDAFRTDDFATAFSFASPNIQRMFRNPDTFGLMVRQGYPMVWRPAEVLFLELRDVGGRQFQKVMIRDQAGAFHLLEYQMIEADGGWQINGVQLLQPPELGA